MKIKDWNAEDMPRERMLSCGPAALSTAELLAILLRTGTREKNVVDVSRELLSSADNSLARLGTMSVEAMEKIDGIGKGKALLLGAAFELGRRLANERDKAPDIINNAEDAVGLLRRSVTTLAREECWCLFLKRSRAVIGSMRISEGGESMTEIDIKRIVARALDLKASAVILSHNHPSADPRPSVADIKLTKQLKQALQMFEIALVDHIIITERKCYSFSMDSEF